MPIEIDFLVEETLGEIYSSAPQLMYQRRKTFEDVEDEIKLKYAFKDMIEENGGVEEKLETRLLAV